MSRVAVQKLNLFYDDARHGFIGIFLDQENNRAEVFLRCNMRSKFEDMKDQLDNWNKSGVVKPQEELTAFIQEMGKVIADEQNNKKRFILGNIGLPYKITKPNIVHTFPEDGVLSSTGTFIQTQLTVNELHVMSLVYATIMQITGALKTMQNFVDAIQRAQADHVLKHSIRFIESLNIEEGWGMVY